MSMAASDKDASAGRWIMGTIFLKERIWQKRRGSVRRVRAR